MKLGPVYTLATKSNSTWSILSNTTKRTDVERTLFGRHSSDKNHPLSTVNRAGDNSLSTKERQKSDIVEVDIVEFNFVDFDFVDFDNVQFDFVAVCTGPYTALTQYVNS